MTMNWITKIPSYTPSSARTHSPIQNLSDYVYFSEATKGHSGKVVKIKVDLFSRFAALVDPNSCDGQTTIRQIEALRATNCAGPGVHTDIRCSFRYMLKVKNMKVFYSVLDGKDKGKKEIFIGDIQADFAAGIDKPGLYVYNTNSKKMVRNEGGDLDDRAVYLNGLCGSMLDAVEKAKIAREITGPIVDLAVFYTPGNIVNDLGIWSSGVQSQQTRQAIAELTGIIKANNKKRVYWVAEGEGADILSKALDGETGSIRNHVLRLIDPMTNTPELLQKSRAKEMRPSITGEVAPVTYSGEGRALGLSVEATKQATINFLKNLKVSGNSESFHIKSIATLESRLGNTQLGSNAQHLQNVAGLNKHMTPPSVAQPKPNMAALSFVQALKRV